VNALAPSEQDVAPDSAAPRQLLREYEDLYVKHLDLTESEDLEERLQSALRVSDLAHRLVAAGLSDRMEQIHRDYRD